MDKSTDLAKTARRGAATLAAAAGLAVALTSATTTVPTETSAASCLAASRPTAAVAQGAEHFSALIGSVCGR